MKNLDLIIGGACFFLGLFCGIVGLNKKYDTIGNLGVVFMVAAALIFWYF